MARKHQCGPETDAEFFSQIADLMKRYPAMAKKYHVVCVDHQTDMMKIDFSRSAAVSRIEDQRIITEFKDRASIGSDRMDCCSWCFIDNSGRYKCCGWWA
jgi:hypothetical protein